MFINTLGTDVGTSTIAGKGSAKAPEKEKELGRNDFLSLLITQLKHQDPLNPMEGTAFSAQLAQFTSLEQLFDMNVALGNIQKALDAQDSGNVLDYIGKVVKTDNNTLLVKEGKTSGSTYNLENPAYVNIIISDVNGSEVRRLNAGWKPAGEHNLDWEGRDNNKKSVGDGLYTYEIEAADENGLPVAHTARLTGEVTGVTYEGKTPFLMIGENLVLPDNVTEVKKGVETTETVATDVP